MLRNWAILPGLLWLALLYGAFLPTAVGRPAGEGRDTIDMALEVSGVEHQVKMLSPAILAAIPSEVFQRPVAKQRVASILRKSLAPGALVESVKKSLLEDFDPEKLRQVIAFYKSKVGRKVARVTRRALNPSLLARVRQNRQIVTKLSASRRALLEKVAAFEEVADFAPTLQLAVVRGLVEGRVSGGVDSPETRRQLQRNLDAAEEKIRANGRRIEGTATVSFAYMFRGFKDEELEEFLSFLDTEAAEWFGSCVRRGIEAAVYETSVLVGRIMTQGGSAGPSDQGASARASGLSSP